MSAPNAGILDTVLNSFRTQIDSGFTGLQGGVAATLSCLIVITVVWMALMWALDEGGQIWGPLIRKAITIGFWSYMITNWQTTALNVYTAFGNLGATAGGTSGLSGFLNSPSQVVALGIKNAQVLVDLASYYCGNAHTQWGTPPQAATGFDIGAAINAFLLIAVDCLEALVCALVVFIAYFWLALEVVVTTIEFHIVILMGFCLLPFGVFERTSSYAERVLGYVISAGFKVMALGVVIAIGTSYLTNSQLTYTPGSLPGLDVMTGDVLEILILLMLALSAPKYAQAVVSGSTTTGVGSLAAAGGLIAGLGFAAAGIAKAAGGAIGGLSGGGGGGGGNPIQNEQDAAGGPGGQGGAPASGPSAPPPGGSSGGATSDGASSSAKPNTAPTAGLAAAAAGPWGGRPTGDGAAAGQGAAGQGAANETAPLASAVGSPTPDGSASGAPTGQPTSPPPSPAQAFMAQAQQQANFRPRAAAPSPTPAGAMTAAAEAGAAVAGAEEAGALMSSPMAAPGAGVAVASAPPPAPSPNPGAAVAAAADASAAVASQQVAGVVASTPMAVAAPGVSVASASPPAAAPMAAGAIERAVEAGADVAGQNLASAALSNPGLAGAVAGAPLANAVAGAPLASVVAAQQIAAASPPLTGAPLSSAVAQSPTLSGSVAGGPQMASAPLLSEPQATAPDASAPMQSEPMQSAAPMQSGTGASSSMFRPPRVAATLSQSLVNAASEPQETAPPPSLKPAPPPAESAT